MQFGKVYHMNEAEHQLVSDAVSAAEAQTSGEIVTIVADTSDKYHDIAVIAASFIAFLALTVLVAFPVFYHGLIDKALGGWQHPIGEHAYLIITASAVAIIGLTMWLIMHWMPMRMMLTPKSVKVERVRNRAVDLFKVGTQARTKGETGILIYLSMREHRAEIVADETIANKVSPEIWGDAMTALLKGVKTGHSGQGMADAVSIVGTVLAEYFPHDDDNPNELPDRLIEL